jgi:hypothetical protein
MFVNKIIISELSATYDVILQIRVSFQRDLTTKSTRPGSCTEQSSAFGINFRTDPPVLVNYSATVTVFNERRTYLGPLRSMSGSGLR